MFVICSTNTGKALVKLMTCSDVSRRWVDMRGSGTFLEKPQVLPITTTDHAATKGLTSGSLGDISWVQKAASLLYRMCHSSTCPPNIQVRNCMWSVLPHISTSSDKCWGRRPGYEATSVQGWLLAWSSYWSSVYGVCLHTRGLLGVGVDIRVAGYSSHLSFWPWEIMTAA